MPARLATTTVAVDGPVVVGFVTVVDDEVEQLYVAPGARGGDVAAALLDHGEALVSMRYDSAWLAVVAGNARARRFYARRGSARRRPLRPPGRRRRRHDGRPSHRYDKTVGGR